MTHSTTQAKKEKNTPGQLTPVNLFFTKFVPEQNPLVMTEVGNTRKTQITRGAFGALLAGVLFASFASAQTVYYFFEDFDSYTANCRVDSASSGLWTINDGGNCSTPLTACATSMNEATWTVRAFLGSSQYLSGNVAELYYSTSCYHLDTLITPPVNTGGSPLPVYLSFNHWFNFWSTNWGRVEVYDGSGWIVIDSFGSWTDDVHGKQIYDVTAYANSQFRVRFIYYDNNDWYWRLDSIMIFSACLPPDSLQVVSLCPDAILVSWAPAGNDSLTIEWGSAGFTPGTGTRITITGLDTNTSIVLSGIPAGTYDVYIWAWCGSTTSDTLQYSLAFESIPYLETFDASLSLPAGWRVSSTGEAYVDSASACGGAVNFLKLEGVSGAYAETPCIDVGGRSEVEVSFVYRTGDGTCGNDPEGTDDVIVWWRADGGVWDTLTLLDGGNNVWTFTRWDTILNLAAVQSIQLRFEVLGGSGATFDHWYFDSVRVRAVECDVAVAGFQVQPDTFCLLDTISIGAQVANQTAFPVFAQVEVNLVGVGMVYSDTMTLGGGVVRPLNFNIFADTAGGSLPPGGVSSLQWVVSVSATCDTAAYNDTMVAVNYVNVVLVDSLAVPDSVSGGVDTTVWALISGLPDSVLWMLTGGSPSSAVGVGPHVVRWDSAGTYTVYVYAYCGERWVSGDSAVIVVLAGPGGGTGGGGGPTAAGEWQSEGAASVAVVYSPAARALAVGIFLSGGCYELHVRDLAGKLLLSRKLVAGGWSYASLSHLPFSPKVVEVVDVSSGQVVKKVLLSQ